MKKTALPLKEYVGREVSEILSPLNVYSTGEALNRPVNPDDPDDRNKLFEHWVESGGLKRFNEAHEINPNSS